MELSIKGPLPEDSAERFMVAMSDTHVTGLINHCVEVLVWRRTILGFLTGCVITWVILHLMR
jgi:hypothetical protein